MSTAREDQRRRAFGRFVTRARDRWLDGEPTRRKGEFGAFVGSSTSTIDRWMKGQWTADPDRVSIDQFCRALNIDPQVAYTTLGWGTETLSRAIPQPESDPDLDLIGRKLRDPHVPEAEKRHIRSMIRFLARNSNTGGEQDTG